MGFLTDDERRNLRIEAMSLHVVGDGDFTPEPARDVEHAAFFIGRIVDTDVAPVYSFTDASATRATLERISGGEITFEIGAQDLAREFSRWHRATAREGAFFIFALGANDPQVKLYSLVKYDYQEAIEQADGEAGHNLLRRIVQAFVADKKAIQKSAMVRVVNGQAELALSAHDRVKQGADIGDYFASFLDVTRSRSDQELNEAVVDVLRKTLQESRELLPELDVARAVRHAKGVLRDRQEIREEAIVDAILSAAGDPEEEETRELLMRRTAKKIRSAKLSGLVFRPDRRIMGRPPIRRIKTTEGVTVTYPDEANAPHVRREPAPNGGEVITITTDRVVEDALVRDSAS